MDNNDSNKDLGLRLRQLRKQRRLSLKRVAEKCGISYQQLQKYESGRNRLSVQRLQQIAAILDIKVSALLEPHSDSQMLFCPLNRPSQQIDRKAALYWEGIEDEKYKTALIEIMELMYLRGRSARHSRDL